MGKERLATEGDVELVPGGVMRSQVLLPEEHVQVIQVRLANIHSQPSQLVVEVLHAIQVYGRVGEDSTDHGRYVRDLHVQVLVEERLGVAVEQQELNELSKALIAIHKQYIIQTYKM